MAHISPNGNTLVASTYYGSPKYDQSYFIRTGKDNYVYIYGQTKADSSTLIKNAAYSVPNSGQFIAKFNKSLDSLKMSTVFGTGSGSPNISPSAFAVDVCNRIYAAGWGRCWGGYAFGNTNYPWGNVFGTVNMAVTPGAYQPLTDGQDFYMMVLGPNAATLDYATYFGELHGTASLGNDHVDGGTSKFDRKGFIYQSVCASCGGSNSFPTFPNPGAWSNTNNAVNCNNAVVKFNLNNDFAIADFLDPVSTCAPDTVNFINTSVGLTYVWNFGDGSPLSTLSNPTHIYTHSGIYNITLVSTLLQGCHLKDTLIKQFIVLSDTSYSIPDAHACKGGSTQIGILPTSDPTISYKWIPTTNLTDPTIANPIANPTTTTNYMLVVSKTNNNNCRDTIKQKVVVYSLSVNAGNDTLICSDSIKLIAHQNNDGIIKFYWSTNHNFTDTLNVNHSDSIVTVKLNAPKYFFVKVRNQYCEGIDSIHVGFSIFSNPVNPINPSCHDSCNGQASVNPTGGTPPYSYLWSNNKVTPTITGLCAGVYSVTITDALGCKSISNVTLSQPAPIVLTHTVVNDPCDGVCVGKITINASGGTPNYSYLWNTFSTSNPLTNLCKGWYVVNVTDSHNCKAKDSAEVVIQSVFTGAHAWADQDTIYKELSTGLHATHISGVTYQWSPASSLNNTTTADPIATPLVTTIYYVTMRDQYGCTKTDSVIIYVIDINCREPYIYVPNAFTPNNDNNNDVLFVRSKVFESMKFSIFDRWGEKVFETDNINKGWDGYFNGKMCQPGVFVYYLEGTCLNKRTFNKQGNITLIR